MRDDPLGDQILNLQSIVVYIHILNLQIIDYVMLNNHVEHLPSWHVELVRFLPHDAHVLWVDTVCFSFPESSFTVFEASIFVRSLSQ